MIIGGFVPRNDRQNLDRSRGLQGARRATPLLAHPHSCRVTFVALRFGLIIRQEFLASQHRVRNKNQLSARLAWRNESNMALYAVDVRDRVIQRVTRQYNGVRDNKRFFLIEAVSAKQAWAKASLASGAIGSDDCSCCHHRYCRACEECSVTKRYSDYWICHGCGELNRRVQNTALPSQG